MTPTARPMANEPTAKIILALRTMADLCTELGKAIYEPTNPDDARRWQAEAVIMNRIMGAHWAVQADALREAAFRLEEAKTP